MKPNTLSRGPGQYKGVLKRWIPRTESWILLIGLVCTVSGKVLMMQRQSPPDFSAELVRVLFPDVLFFSFVFLAIRCLYIAKPSAVTARFALVIGVLVSAWSVLNMAWLVASGLQLQPGILKLLCRDIKKLWPLIQPHIMVNIITFSLLGITAILGFAYCLWQLLRPAKVHAARIHHIYWGLGIFLAIAVMLFARAAVPQNPNLSFTCETLNFSSHWNALTSTLTGFVKTESAPIQTRNIARAGQRKILIPQCPSSQLPNVVLLLLESIPHSVTSLADPAIGTTSNLARLAREGVQFRTTRVPVPYTTEAFWAVLTSTTPIIQTANPETVPIEPPYEGLPSILARAGYRSAFFEMSKGSFECAPGFFHNLAFDWAWFRENLCDPSAHLGYMNGDDCRLIEPAMRWALESAEPFLLMMITSVSHDPYKVPSWFGEIKEKVYDNYLQTVRYSDYFLGQLCSALHDHGLDRNTIICILGDHGTSFRVQTAKGRWVPYEEVIRVPWIIHWPGRIEAGKVIDWPCSQLDVTPTILKLVGFDISRANFEGKDAFSVSQPNRRLYFSSLLDNSPTGFVEGNRKVVYWPYNDKVFEYYLDADPTEENPTTLSSGEVEQIKRDIKDWQAKTQIKVETLQYKEALLFSHWQTFSTGQTAWAYYVP